MTFSKREKHILIITAFILISALVYNFIMEPLVKKWQGINREILAKEIRFKKGSKLVSNRDVIIKEYKSCETSLKDISKILAYIETQSVSSGVKIAGMRPRPIVQKDFYQEYTIELQIEGTLGGINKFLSELIKSPVFVSLKKFDLRVLSENSSYLKGSLLLSKIII